MTSSNHPTEGTDYLLPAIRAIRQQLPALTANRERAHAEFMRAAEAERAASEGLAQLITLARHNGLVVPEAEVPRTQRPPETPKYELLDAIRAVLAATPGGKKQLSAREIHEQLKAHPERLVSPNPALNTVSQALSENKGPGNWKLCGAGRLAKWEFDPKQATP